MKEPSTASKDEQEIVIDLRSPGVAAVLAWLIPGAGHFYQRRFGKGILFFCCILGIYFFGLTLGDGKVVYASFRTNDIRWQYVCQLPVGLPAVPALIQSQRVIREQKPPLWKGWMAPPQHVNPNFDDQLSQWHLNLKWKFELATLYTMIAGLLNVLAIYDAFAGPMILLPDSKEREPAGSESGKQPDDS
ncbi:MAG: hypothetical protein FJ295_06235 [Planctomycetes bacterium]|nr:hypothetical protein [Planctomycetota bacterium]